MRPPRRPRPPLPVLLCVLAAVSATITTTTAATTAAITPSNSTVSDRYFTGTLPLQDVTGGNSLASVVPLTGEAAQRAVEGDLVLTTDETVADLNHGDIALISCDPGDYRGLISPLSLLTTADQKANLSATILYSIHTPYCAYDQPTDGPLSQLPVYSMTDAAAADQLGLAARNTVFRVRVRPRAANDAGSMPGQQNPLGPSPSTAVAMIILYSITGIITALFLVIILTGAIRAHRHPERYGPRNVLGGPRQSRARGLGRAILDTIPIVKFGDKEPPKPTDVELASTTANSATLTPHDMSQRTTEAQDTSLAAPPTQPAVAAQSLDATPAQPIADETSGIAPAESLTAAQRESTSSQAEDTLGCTICTEDFEKGQDIRVLPCDHKFHPECVDPWLLNVSGTCPLCRVDLRPTISHDSTISEGAQQELPPPLNSDPENSHRRRVALLDILSLRQRPNASPEERISALRRLREQVRNQSRDALDPPSHQSIEPATRPDRHSRRFSARLSDVFSTRPRRQETSPDDTVRAQQSSGQETT